jgi:anti-sigma regulatory factor (Ser/Thr protein kinase)
MPQPSDPAISPEPAGSAELFIEARITLSSDIRFLGPMRHTIENLAMEMGWNESESRAITLAVEEAFTNKIRHAYKNRPDCRIQFDFRTEPGVLVFVLTDQGEAPDPARICHRDRDAPSLTAGGFGTLIIRDVMDEVIYQTVGEGNQLILKKYLPETKQPLTKKEDSQ